MIAHRSHQLGRTPESTSGQALVEFALVAPLLFLMLLGIIQLGFMFSGQNGLTNAAREAARYASTLPTPDTFASGNCGASGTNAQKVYQRLATINLGQYVAGYRQSNLVQPSPLGTCASTAQSGTASGVAYCTTANGDGTFALQVRVTVVYDHPLFIPLVGRLFSSSNVWRSGASEEMRVEGPNRPAATTGGFALCP